MSLELNQNIKILTDHPIVNTKASEVYVDVIFTYGDYSWAGYDPIEYRRTGISIDFEDKEKLYPYLNSVYVQMKPNKMDAWKKNQEEFWKTKPGATTTKEFFDTLAEGGWKCGACEMPRNPNPQRRIQDLKEFGYTIATDLSRYCPHCGRNTSQRILLPIIRGGNEGNGYETWSPALRKRIVQVLGNIDVYEDVYSPHCLPDHKFSEIRWDDNTEYFVSVRHPRPQEVRHPHRENPTPIPHRWCMAAARIAHGRHAVGSFRNCVQPSHGLAFNGQYMRVVNDTVADGIGHGRIIKQLMPAGDVELRTEVSGCHLTPGFN